MENSTLLGEIRSGLSKVNTTTTAIIGGGIIALGTAVYATKQIGRCQERSRLKKIIDTRRTWRDKELEKLKKEYILDESAQAIVALSVEELTKNLQERKLSAVQVLKAYMAKAIAVTSKSNCVTEFVPHALEMAEELDKLPTVKGPLHGIPFCAKEDHDVVGMDTTLGFGRYLNNPASKNCVLVQTLVDQGAVPFCKTNVPQSLFSYASHNAIYGETSNCLNETWSPGGSSSGSGSLIGGGGAPFGLGSDIGGSLRIPSHFNGICTLRPTINRLSGKGVMQCLPKCVGFWGVPGIMAKDASTVATVFRAVTSNGMQNSYDAQAMRIPFSDEVFQSHKRLRIGYYTSLPFFPPVGDTIEVVTNAKRELEKLGHTLVPFSLPDDWKYMKLIYDLISVEFGEHSDLNKIFENEPPAIGLMGLRAAIGLPAWRRRIHYYMSKIPFLPSYSKRIVVQAGGGLDQSTCHDVWEMMHERRQITIKILSDMENAGVDLLLTPAFPFPACGIRDPELLFGAIVYTMIWNLVDFPAGIVTYGKESGKNVDKYNDEGDLMLRVAKQATKKAIGAPIAVQLVSKPFCEELVFNVMLQLESSKK